jgi:hypothetical protein
MNDDAYAEHGQRNTRSPLSNAIRTAARHLPAIAATPASMRAANEVAVAITADAMADASGLDSQDPGPGPQLVDEAAISLDLQKDRTATVRLASPVESWHRDLAEYLRDTPAEQAGMADPTSLAKIEEAIGRVLRMRNHEVLTELALMRIIDRLVGAVLDRGVAIREMDDDAIMSLTEDACDASI